jgi:cholesterol 24(S)-hydroxylase
MDIDSINNVDSKFSVYITKLTVLLEELVHDPFAKINPFQYHKIKQVGHMIEFLRNAGREKLFERFKSLENGEELPNDILSNILKSYSTHLFCVIFLP